MSRPTDVITLGAWMIGAATIGTLERNWKRWLVLVLLLAALAAVVYLASTWRARRRLAPRRARARLDSLTREPHLRRPYYLTADGVPWSEHFGSRELEAPPAPKLLVSIHEGSPYKRTTGR